MDAYKDRAEILAEVEDAELPTEMRQMKEAERRAYIEEKAKTRADLQARIQHLNAERKKYVAQQMKQNASKDTLDAVVVSAVREQAQKKNFKFE